MRHRLVRLLAVAACTSLLAACGGAHSAAVPTARGGLSPQLNGGPGNLGSLATLYVSGQGAVFAYDLTASGNDAPVSKTTGYYYQAGGPGGVSASIAGIATNAAGDLVLVQNYKSPQGDGDSCQIVLIPARTTTTAANATSGTCNNTEGGNTTGKAIGITYTGYSANSDITSEIDVLMHYVHTGNSAVISCSHNTTDQYEINRYSVANGSIVPDSCLEFPSGVTGTYHAIAGSTNGAFFVDYTPSSGSDTIERYDSEGESPTATANIPGAGALAVSVDTATNTGYRVVASTVAGTTTIYNFRVQGATMTFTHALGTFANPVTALAVDNGGTVYVGVNQPNGVTKVKVYGPSKTEATAPDRVLNNPVRRPNPAASPAAAITGIAIAQ